MRVRKIGLCRCMLSYVNLGFFGHQGFFGPIFRHREAQLGQKSVNRQTVDVQKFSQKKLERSGYLSEKISPLYDKNSQRYVKKLLVVFIFPSQ